MFYMIVSNGVLDGVVDYVPNIPTTSHFKGISKEQYDGIINQTHSYDHELDDIVKIDEDNLPKLVRLSNYRNYLNSTDWMVLRHIREKALGLSLSLSEEDYIDLEQKRQEYAKML